MIKYIITLLAVGIAYLPLLAQYPAGGCATTATKQITERLLANKAQLAKQPVQFRTTEYVPVTFHLAADNDGSGRVSYGNLADQICSLNESFKEVNIQFYIKAFNEINDTRINQEHYRYESLMRAERDSRSINVFILDNANTDASGGGEALGYYSGFYDWLVMRESEINGISATLTHEMGHFFDLLHPFNGWDFEPYNETDHGAQVPTRSPEGVLTELMDKSNCDRAGDYVCDTPPDYNFQLYFRDCNYNLTVKDPNGEVIDPHEQNFMSYFFFCDFEFTADQKELMQVSLQTPQRSYVRSNYQPSETVITEAPTLVSPIGGTVTDTYRDIQLSWQAVEGADGYIIEIDQQPSFNYRDQGYVVWGQQQTQFTIPVDLEAQKRYFWRIRPIGEYYLCTESTRGDFRAGQLATSLSTINELKAWSIQPNPITVNQPFLIDIDSKSALSAVIELTTTTGQVMQRTQTQLNSGINRLQFDIPNVAAGLYLVTLKTNEGVATKKVIVNQ